MKKIYIVRHCEANGQPPESTLTQRGLEQSLELKQFFTNIKINRILSSPFLRAVHSIQPTVSHKQLQLEIDDRLAERVLSTEKYSDWLTRLEETYYDLDLKFIGGESSREAIERVLSLVEEIINDESEGIIIVTHGNLMSLLLMHFDSEFGFAEWKMLSNLDVFELSIDTHENKFKRIWKS